MAYTAEQNGLLMKILSAKIQFDFLTVNLEETLILP
jgi:hypothetical protein